MAYSLPSLRDSDRGTNSKAISFFHKEAQRGRCVNCVKARMLLVIDCVFVLVFSLPAL
jgi:hypothetical protein